MLARPFALPFAVISKNRTGPAGGRHRRGRL